MIEVDGNGVAAVIKEMLSAVSPDGKVLHELRAERYAQDQKWGEQNHKDGTGSPQDVTLAEFTRQHTNLAFELGFGTWADILLEEVHEALAESDPAKLSAELIQVAAVAVAWVEAIDRRSVDG